MELNYPALRLVLFNGADCGACRCESRVASSITHTLGGSPIHALAILETNAMKLFGLRD